jgi:hypothetical protein
MSHSVWERLWRAAGIQFAVLFIAGYLVYGDQPGVGAPAAKLVSFYDGNRTRILVATVIFGLALLSLLWFHRRFRKQCARVRAERLRLGVRSDGLLPDGDADRGRCVRAQAGGNDLERRVLRRCRDRCAGAPGRTTWASNGIWAPDGAYSRFVVPFIAVAWIAAISGLLTTRTATTTPAAAAIAQVHNDPGGQA